MTTLRWLIAIALMTSMSSAMAKKKKQKQPEKDCKEETAVESAASDVMAVAAVISPDDGCADAAKLQGICDYVSFQLPPKNKDLYEYGFEEKVFAAACVKEADSEEVISKKIKKMWSKLEDPYLKCTQANFDLAKGNILKYAIVTRSYYFLTTAAEDWKVNMNSIDPTDGRTVLDYLQNEIDRKKGTEYEGPLKSYYFRLKKMGAKHKAELW